MSSPTTFSDFDLSAPFMTVSDAIVNDLVEALITCNLRLFSELLEDEATYQVKLGGGDTIFHALARGAATNSEYRYMLQAALSHQLFQYYYRDVINELNDDGYTALHLALQTRSTKITQLILSSGASAQKKSSRGESPIHILARSSSPNFDDDALNARNTKKTEALFSTLLHYKASTRSVDGNHIQPLVISVQELNLPLTTLLLKNKASPNSLTQEGVAIADYLLEELCKARPEKERRAAFEILKVLVDNGAPILSLNLEILQQLPQEVFEYLISLSPAIEEVSRETLLANPSSELEEISEKQRLLERVCSQIASQCEEREIHKYAETLSIEEFQVKYPPATVRASALAVDKDLNTPMHRAAQAGNIEVVQYLATHKCPVNAMNIDKKSPFELAAKNKHYECAATLADKLEAFVDKLEVEDLIELLELCKSTNRKGLFSLVLSTLTKPFKEKEGKTSLELCLERGNEPLFELILKHATSATYGYPVVALKKLSAKLEAHFFELEFDPTKGADKREEIELYKRANERVQLAIHAPFLRVNSPFA